MGSHSSDSRTLLVDDSEIIQKTYSSLLESFSFSSVDIVDNGEEAIEMYKKSLEENKPYELVILDYHLPGINGADVLSNFRSLETEKSDEIKAYVIIATTNTHQHVPLDMLDRGADDYLIKPVMKESFKTAIDCFLEA